MSIIGRPRPLWSLEVFPRGPAGDIQWGRARAQCGGPNDGLTEAGHTLARVACKPQRRPCEPPVSINGAAAAAAPART